MGWSSHTIERVAFFGPIVQSEAGTIWNDLGTLAIATTAIAVLVSGVYMQGRWVIKAIRRAIGDVNRAELDGIHEAIAGLHERVAAVEDEERQAVARYADAYVAAVRRGDGSGDVTTDRRR